MVSITNITTGKIRTHILTFKSHKDGTRKSITFRDGKFYYNYGTTVTELVNGVTQNGATTLVSSVTT